jgi:hypothetical protein
MNTYTEDMKKIYNERYYNKKKDKLLEKAKEKVYCEICDAYINKSSYLRHLKSSKHKLKEQICILANPSSDEELN